MEGSHPSRKRPLPSAIVFDATLAQNLSSADARLPPTYVGVRRVRPSSHMVQNALQREKGVDKQQETVVFKIVDEATGQERRMTAKEKKERKLKLKEEEKERKAQGKLNHCNRENATATDTSSEPILRKRTDAPEIDETDETLVLPPSDKSGRYVSLKVDPIALEQEMADLRGDRNRVPPVFLSPALTQAALRSNILHGGEISSLKATVDDEYASRWAVALKNHMRAAEGVRDQEDIRPMAYQLIPEVWSRMRPKGMGQQECPPPRKDSQNLDSSSASIPPRSFCAIRPASLRSEAADNDFIAVVDALHSGTTTHVSCGAKFGCDYLLYDGPRNERHAFAGLRVIHGGTSAADNAFPLPSAYDMAGFVRCLNTAGKLALLATVNHHNDKVSVAFLDLALEKLASATSRPRRKMPNSLQKM